MSVSMNRNGMDGRMASAGSGDPERRPSLAVRVLGSLSTAAAMAVLGGLAYWGHATEWTFGVLHLGTGGGVSSAPPASVARVAFGPSGTATVAYDSEEAVDRVGIEVGPVWKAEMIEAITASGELSFDPRVTARLSSRAPGVAHCVEKSVGDPVRAGDMLALIDAAEVGRAKAEFQQAFVQVRLKRKAAANVRVASSAVPEQQRREAEAALRDAEVRLSGAEQALVNLGLPARAGEYDGLPLDEVVRRMRGLGVPGDPTTANLLPVRAPVDGVVLTRDIVTGEVVEPGKVLFVVVDPRRLWLTLHVPANDIRRVAVGQTALFRPDGSKDEVAGKVAWVGTSADEATRTVPVRAELPNDGGRLRASTLGQGRIVLRIVPQAVVVPPSAVHVIGGESVVFVRNPDFLKPGGPKAFHRRAVRTGAADGTNVEILDGLRLDEVVAAKGSRVLLGELQRAGPPPTLPTKGPTP